MSNSSRSLENRAEGKHIGHACEGHLRAILTNIDKINDENVIRELPFDFPVDPDIVIVNREGIVSAVGIVAYWDNADNSHMKYYRTRLEYKEMVRAHSQNPEFFDDGFVLVTVVYGSPGGWKEQILYDLADQCAPFLFLPEVLGANDAENIVERAFGVYRDLWEAGETQVREAVENHFSEENLIPLETDLLQKVQSILEGGGQHETKKDDQERTSANVPSEPFRTRLRQALGVLSVFKPEEINAWLDERPLDENRCEGFSKRAFFLDLGSFRNIKTLAEPEIEFNLREPTRVSNGREQYAPDRPDFTDWTRLEKTQVEKILSIHRERTDNPTSVFQGGTYDQIAGNWKEICAQIRSQMPEVVQALKQCSMGQFVQTLCTEDPVTAPDWHPANQEARHYPLWAFTVCALAIEKGSRSTRSKSNYYARRQKPPEESEARDLYTECQSEARVTDRLNKLVEFANTLLNADFDQLAHVERPQLLSLDEPCSWVADFYNTLTTNSSHNPLNEVVLQWLEHTYPKYEWHGWPNKRSRALSTVLEDVSGRRQFQFIGVNAEEEEFCTAEIKSITQNNWGNKSKELYDRVNEAQEAARELGWDNRTVLVFDGDMEADQLEELETGIGHDEVVSIDDVIDVVFDFNLL